MKKSTLLKFMIASALFIALGIWVETEYGWANTLSRWQHVSTATVIFCTLLVYVSHFLRAARIHYAYRQNSPVPITRVMSVSFIHNTVSFILPMRLGELVLPFLSRHQLNIDVKYATATLILVRLLDLHTLVLLLCFFAGSLWLEGVWQYVLPALMMAGLPVAIDLLQRLAHAKKKLAFLTPLLVSHRTWVQLYGFTVVIWGVKLFALALLGAALGTLPIDHTWLATIIADGSALSPVTGFANAGTFEAAFTLPLLPLGYTQSALVPVAVNLHIFIFITNILAGGLGLLMLKKAPANDQSSGT